MFKPIQKEQEGLIHLSFSKRNAGRVESWRVTYMEKILSIRDTEFSYGQSNHNKAVPASRQLLLLLMSLKGF